MRVAKQTINDCWCGGGGGGLFCCYRSRVDKKKLHGKLLKMRVFFTSSPFLIGQLIHHVIEQHG